MGISFPFSRAMRSTDIKEKSYRLAVEKVQTETVPARMLGEVRLAICDRLQPRPRALHLPSDRCVTS